MSDVRNCFDPAPFKRYEIDLRLLHRSFNFSHKERGELDACLTKEKKEKKIAITVRASMRKNY